MGLKGPLIVALSIAGAAGIGQALEVVDLSPAEPLQSEFHKTASSTPQPESFQKTASLGASRTPPDSNPLKYNLTRVAQQYQTTQRYPEYSIPLSADQADAYAGNQYTPTTLPLGERGRFTVIVDQYRFTRGSPIPVVARITGPMTVGQRATASLTPLDGNSQPVEETAMTESSAGEFEAILESDLPSGEYRLIVEAQVDGQPIRHASTITIEPNLGEFGGVDSTSIENNHLTIPVVFEAHDSGTFALSANLYAGSRPVAHLTRETRLSGGSGTIVLRAHGTVLSNLSDSAELALRGIRIRRLPAQPGDRTDHAFGPDDGYRFTADNLNRLSDTPVRNPESDRRAALLKKLARGL